MATPGGATSTPSSRRNIPTATKTRIFVNSPFYALIERAREGEANPSMRRRIGAGPGRARFPDAGRVLRLGATDYVAHLYVYGKKGGDRSQGTGIVYSFATDRKGGFSDDDATLIDATLPALSLAMKAHAGYVIASGLLGTYLGEDAGRRVHAGAVMRGSVDKLRAVIWYADIRGFTPISDAAPGPAVIDLLNDVFEVLTAALRPRGGQVLKFIGDGMLATFSFEEADRADTCRRALDAAVEAMRKLDAMNAARAAAGAPVAAVDLALHLGEVLYGNVGATDRLDFTVIGPAINEVARIEALCEPLGRPVLVSAEFAAGMGAADSSARAARPPHVARRRETRKRFSLSIWAARRRSRRPLWSRFGNSGQAHVVDDPSPLGKVEGIVARHGRLKIPYGEPGVESEPRCKLGPRLMRRPMFAGPWRE